MSETQQRFFDELLAKYPRLQGLWDHERRIFLDESAEAALGVLSPGEATVLRALASIWLGNGDSYRLDFTDLATLSPEWRKPLVEWLLNPFWP